MKESESRYFDLLHVYYRVISLIEGKCEFCQDGNDCDICRSRNPDEKCEFWEVNLPQKNKYTEGVPMENQVDVYEIPQMISNLKQVEQKYRGILYATGEINLSLMARDAASALIRLQGDLQTQHLTLLTCRNELCLKCERYKMAHEGYCDGCRWKEV